MSDWEDIFGAGVPAEGVIGSINASWREEHREHVRQERQQSILSLMSFRGDEALKEEFMLIMMNHLGEFEIDQKLFNPLDVLSLFPNSIDEIEDRFLIPSLILHLSANVLKILSRHDYFNFSKTGESVTFDWLHHFLKAIPVGADLRLAGFKFVGRCVRAVEMRSGHRDHPPFYGYDELDNLRPAADIAYARARGVFAPEALCKMAQMRAWGAEIEPHLDEWAPEEDDILEQRVCASAAAQQPEQVAKALRYLIIWADQNRIFGDADMQWICQKYGADLVANLMTAPTRSRLRIIDFGIFQEK